MGNTWSPKSLACSEQNSFWYYGVLVYLFLGDPPNKMIVHVTYNYEEIGNYDKRKL